MHGRILHDMYDRWAPLYPAEPHNPLMVVEQKLMLERLPPPAGLQILDLACGTGRYARHLRQRGARQVVGLDFSTEMLCRARDLSCVRGDLASLPLRDRAFDLVLSGLALGHAANLAACLAEIARVLQPNGALLYSDFHPEALRRGQTRSFTDALGRKVSLPASEHDRAAHLEGLRGAGFRIECIDEPRVGFEFDQPFAGSERFYREWRGVPMLLIVRARKYA